MTTTRRWGLHDPIPSGWREVPADSHHERYSRLIEQVPGREIHISARPDGLMLWRHGKRGHVLVPMDAKAWSRLAADAAAQAAFLIERSERNDDAS